jgi:hypothetical protein
MHVDLFREGFLADAQGFAMFPQRISYALLERCSFHSASKLVC